MQKTQRQLDQSCIRSRSAFTLVEILVVIGIIALLATILVVAMAPAIEGARISATKTTIAQLNHMLQDRINALMADEDTIKSEAKKIKSAYSGDMPVDAAEFYARMKLYRNSFPQRTEDLYGLRAFPSTISVITTSSQLSGLPAPTIQSQLRDGQLLRNMWNGTTWIDGSWIQNAAATPPQYSQNSAKADSSELLYLILSQASPSGNSSAQTIDQINPKHIGDTDKDGNLEFLDAWGQPLQFFNMPTELFADSMTSTALCSTNISDIVTKDPFDPTDRVRTWSTSLSGFTLGSGANSIPVPQLDALKPTKKYWAFIIMSSGPDESLGFNYPNSNPFGTPMNRDHIFDNITNRQ